MAVQKKLARKLTVKPSDLLYLAAREYMRQRIHSITHEREMRKKGTLVDDDGEPGAAPAQLRGVLPSQAIGLCFRVARRQGAREHMILCPLASSPPPDVALARREE